VLFGSLVFIFGFLPIALFAYHALRLAGRARLAKLSLVLSSLVFYGWWDVRYVPLIAGSIVGNFWISLLMQRWPVRARLITGIGIGLNLALLGYYKYANFFVASVDAVTGWGISLPHVVLPLAISFFTFQQIAYLIESCRDRKAADSFVDYALFVLFFPHLIAGPITHHKEMLPQFAVAGRGALPRSYITVGTAIFLMGLAKKALLADGFALFATPLFTAAHQGATLATSDAWLAALGYTLQLYFDFSGYSDMAIGLGLMFGILLPVNFASPYKSTSIIEFWRRWHISLSRFLRNYLYISLGGNRRGPARRQLNLLVTMVLGGLWHGAGWTFLTWGLLHGIYLVINHYWRSLIPPLKGVAPKVVAWLMTMLAVVVAWVLFRAESFSTAASILSSMFLPTGYHGAAPAPQVAQALAWVTVAAGVLIVTRLPNALELARYPQSTPGMPIEHDGIDPVRFRVPALLAAVLLGIVAGLAFAKLPDPGIFLYFNF
jgi:alginate O-acetyltransferase complex protein AlgI